MCYIPQILFYVENERVIAIAKYHDQTSSSKDINAVKIIGSIISYSVVTY